MNSTNQVILEGRLDRDPEILRHAQSNSKIAVLMVATSEFWYSVGSDERMERTERHKVVVFNGLMVDYVEQNLRKGSKVHIEGALESRVRTDISGMAYHASETVLRHSHIDQIVLLPSR